MHATLTAAGIKCDCCRTQLPPQVGENAVLARIRAAENGWTTVSYCPPRIAIARGTRERWRAFAPAFGEFCPACDPLPAARWVALCQERFVAGEPPFPLLRRYGQPVARSDFELIDYKPAGSVPTREVAQLAVKDANKLVMRGKCTWTCLLAMEETCTCRCGGPYHGAAVEALRDLRATVTAPAGAA